MSKFNTTKQKLRKAWERWQRNKSDADQTDNTEQISFLDSLRKAEFFKVPLQIFDKSITVIPTTNVVTAKKNSFLPAVIEYNTSADIEVPEEFLPYVKFSIELDSVPDTEISLVENYETFTHAYDNVEIRGDGILIYKGLVKDVNKSGTRTVFSDQAIIDMGVSLNNTKNVWEATLNTGGKGHIVLIFWRKTVGLVETTFQTGTDYSSASNILSMTSTSFTSIGTEIIDDDGDVTINEDVVRTFNINDADLFKLSLLTFNTILGEIVTDYEKGVDFTSQSFKELGNYLYYSGLTQKLLRLTTTGVDGDFKQLIMNAFPDTDDGDTLPYTSITLKRNLVDPPQDFTKNIIVTSTDKRFPQYVKISKDVKKIPTFRYRMIGDMLLMSRAVIDTGNPTEFPVYDDIYTQVGTTFSLTTTNHSLLEKANYSASVDEATINIKAYLDHPIYWDEQRDYRSNDL